jgi:hypothetical protein
MRLLTLLLGNWTVPSLFCDCSPSTQVAIATARGWIWVFLQRNCSPGYRRYHQLLNLSIWASDSLLMPHVNAW